jgi:hypothetical protein
MLILAVCNAHHLHHHLSFLALIQGRESLRVHLLITTRHFLANLPWILAVPLLITIINTLSGSTRSTATNTITPTS